MSFPQSRFADAGATQQEIERLSAQFDALPSAAQSAQLERWASVGTGDLTEQLEAERQPADEEEASAEQDLKDAAQPGIVTPKPPASDSSTSEDSAKAEASKPSASK